MNKEQRYNASKDQIEHFFSAYYSHWRYAKILINEKILNEKYSFLSKIALDIEHDNKKNPESTIAQELTNGLEFDILSNCIQYIEDLFALLNAGKNIDFFIKSITTYGAGQVENLIKQNFTLETSCKLFHVPYFTKFDDEEFQSAYQAGANKLIEKLNFIKDFYNRYHFFYLQYKHGLTVALRPYKNYTDEQIEKDKTGEMPPYLVAFDNLSFEKTFKNKKKPQNIFLMPHLTINTQPFINELQKEDNLTRYVTAPESPTIEKMKECAIIIRSCMHLFINNILSVIREKYPIEIQLPIDNSQVYVFKFPLASIRGTRKDKA